MVDLGLQGRIEQFSEKYLCVDIELGPVGQDRFHALLHDLNYQKNPATGMFTRTKGSEIEVLMKDNPFEQEKGTLSYITMRNPSELITFSQEYSKLWEDVAGLSISRTEVVSNTALGGVISTVVGGLLSACGAMGNQCGKEGVDCSFWPYALSSLIIGVAGGVGVYFWQRSNYKKEGEAIQGKEKEIADFVKKYNGRFIALGKDAYNAALTLPEV